MFYHAQCGFTVGGGSEDGHPSKNSSMGKPMSYILPEARILLFIPDPRTRPSVPPLLMMNLFSLPLLFQVVSPLPLILAGPLDWSQEPESGTSVATGLERRDLVSRNKGKLSRPQAGLVARQKRPETASAQSTQQNSRTTSEVTDLTSSS